ncbi:MAG: hypothetical protein U1F16_12390 [Turneriella sp.]
MKRNFFFSLLGAMALSTAIVFAQKGDGKPKVETKAEAAVNPPEAPIEYEEVWLPIGTVFNFPEGSKPAEVFPTGAKYMPNAKTPLRVRSRKTGHKISVRVEGLHMHSKYYVKPRRGSWTFEANKGDFVERMIRRPKPVAAEPEVVQKVDLEEKKEVQEEAATTEIETVKDTTAIATQIKETEKVSEDFSRPFHNRMFGVYAGYVSNYTEHYAQYFTLPSSAWLGEVDFYAPAVGRISFQYLLSGKGDNVPTGSNYKNPNLWKLSYASEHFFIFIKSQTTANPGGLLLRDFTATEIGIKPHYGFSITERGWFDFGSNFIMIWYEDPTTQLTTTKSIKTTLLINLTADFSFLLWRLRGFLDIYGNAGTAYSIGDGTAIGYDASGSWNTTAASQRKFQFAGAKFGLAGYLQLIDAFRINVRADWYPFMSKDYARFTSLTRETSTSMFVLNIGGETRF